MMLRAIIWTQPLCGSVATSARHWTMTNLPLCLLPVPLPLPLRLSLAVLLRCPPAACCCALRAVLAVSSDDVRVLDRPLHLLLYLFARLSLLLLLSTRAGHSSSASHVRSHARIDRYRTLRTVCTVCFGWPFRL